MNASTMGPNVLVVEPHAFFASYLRTLLARSGRGTVSSTRYASLPLLRRLRPDTIVIGAGCGTRRPLAAIRRARRERPTAHIVVYLDRHDPTWAALARALGADIVLDAATNGRALCAAAAC